MCPFNTQLVQLSHNVLPLDDEVYKDANKYAETDESYDYYFADSNNEEQVLDRSV